MIYNLKKQSKEAKDKLDELIGKGVTIEIIDLTERSKASSSYLHVVIQMYAIEHGETLNDAKSHLKELCPFVGNFVKTSKMNTKEMRLFTEWVVTYCEMHGMLVPSSEKWRENMAEIDKEIRKSQKYL